MSQRLIHEMPIECQVFEGSVHRMVHQVEVAIDNMRYRVMVRALARVDQDIVVRISPHNISVYIEET